MEARYAPIDLLERVQVLKIENNPKARPIFEEPKSNNS